MARRGQSFTRKLKRGNLVAIWNPTFKRYDFFRKAKNSGRFLVTHPFVHNSGVGPGLHKESINAIQRELANR